MPLKGIRVSMLVVGVLVAGCGDSAGPSATPAWSTPSLAAESNLSPDDEIDGLDVAVDSDGTVHLVWRELIGLYGGEGDERIVYRRGEGSPLRWSRPLIVSKKNSRQPQIAVTGKGVHITAGFGLRHWLLPHGSHVFADLGDMLPDETSAATHGAITVDNRFVVVFRALQNRGHPGVYAASWSFAGATAPKLIATAVGSTSGIPIRPGLHRMGDGLIAAWAEHGITSHPVDATGARVHRSFARVRVAASQDAGLSWGSPSEVMRVDANAVAAAGTATAPLVFIATHGLYGSRLADGSWTDPVRIAAYKPGSLSGSIQTSAVAAAQCGGRTTLLWADARHRRSDRRWWNPLGGFPWSDNPDWYNNDVFLAHGVDLDGDEAAIDPVRLTSGTSRTAELAVARRGGELLVFRVGRTSVRKSPDDAGAPPVILQTSIACR